MVIRWSWEQPGRGVLNPSSLARTSRIFMTCTSTSSQSVAADATLKHLFCFASHGFDFKESEPWRSTEILFVTCHRLRCLLALPRVAKTFSNTLEAGLRIKLHVSMALGFSHPFPSYIKKFGTYLRCFLSEFFYRYMQT